MEKDQVRGNDSLVTFEEILQIAKDKDVSSLLQETCIFFPWKDWPILFSILITWIVPGYSLIVTSNHDCGRRGAGLRVIALIELYMSTFCFPCHDHVVGSWEVFGAICSQSHSLKYLRESAAGSLRLRTCSTQAHFSAMGVLMGGKMQVYWDTHGWRMSLD